MRIAIDGIAMSHPQPGGYRTYVTNLVEHLAQVDRANDYVLLVDRPVGWHPPENWSVHVLPTQLSSLGVVWREQVALPRFVRNRRVDLLHLPCATGPTWCPVPTVITMYDTIEFEERLPSLAHPRRWAMHSYSRLAQRRAAQRARAIITISHYSQERIAKRLRLATAQIVVTSCAPSPSYHPLDRHEAEAHVKHVSGVNNYILAFASLAPRKNTFRLMQAYARMDESLREAHPLCLICTHPSVRAGLERTARSLGLAQNLVMVVRPSDENLLWLYNGAHLFVFPSLDEGFGLPPLEAMRCGVPVVAANAGSLPEVLGDAAILVSPTDIDGLAQAINDVLTQRIRHAELSQRGLEHSGRFVWEDVARRTVEVYEKVHLASASG